MSDNKGIGLTDNDVVKALEFVARYCKDGYNDIRVDQLLLSTIDLIKRQQAEIERLKGYNENLQTANVALSNEILDIKSEAIKEFAAKLKESAHDLDISFGYGTPPYCKVVSVGEIDNLVKEMTEDENNG